MYRYYLALILLSGCVSIEYPEPIHTSKPITVNLSSDCVLKPSSGVIYFIITDDKKLPSTACNMNAWGCAVTKGNKHYVYSITNWAIYFEEMGHAAGCLDHVK